MASIRKKGRRHQVVWAVLGKDGKRRQISRSFATMAAAKDHRAKVELLERRGIGAPKISLGNYLPEWLQRKLPEIEPTTAAGYRRWIGHIRRCPVAEMPLDRVYAGELEQIYRFLQETPAGRGKPLSPQSVRHCHALLENALGDAVRHRRIAENPATHAKPPRGQSPRRTIPDAAQIAALLDDLARTNPTMTDLALVILGTGLRRSEALGLRWQDVDVTAGQMTVRQVVIEHDGTFSLRTGTKSVAGYRTISIATPVLDALRRQHARSAEDRLKLGRFWRDGGLVFADPASGGPRAPAAVTRAFTRAAQRAGWPAHASPVHGLRHAAASLALANGVDLAVIARRLGHSSAAVTARIYLHSDADRDRAAAEIMAGNSVRRRRND
jgi:integrase